MPLVLSRLIASVEPVPEVTLLPARSRTHTVTLEVAAPLAGIGFGTNVGAPRLFAGPKPVNDAVPVAAVSVPDVPVASQTSALASLMLKRTVEPVAPAVLQVAGLPAPPAGTVLMTVAVQWVVVLPVCHRFSVTGVAVKTGLPAASWTWKVT